MAGIDHEIAKTWVRFASEVAAHFHFVRAIVRVFALLTYFVLGLTHVGVIVTIYQLLMRALCKLDL